MVKNIIYSVNMNNKPNPTGEKKEDNERWDSKQCKVCLLTTTRMYLKECSHCNEPFIPSKDIEELNHINCNQGEKCWHNAPLLKDNVTEEKQTSPVCINSEKDVNKLEDNVTEEWLEKDFNEKFVKGNYSHWLKKDEILAWVSSLLHTAVEKRDKEILSMIDAEIWTHHIMGERSGFSEEQQEIINELCMRAHNNPLLDIKNYLTPTK